tara:strand:+ start:97 stop:642 length:546 start_codon:yes stop_codon:yes gene_type:complete
MSRNPPSDSALRVADLAQNAITEFALRPDAETLSRIAQQMDLSALRKLSFTGTLRSIGRTDWQLQGQLGATVVQPCVVTLEPVTTRIDAPIERRYVADFADPDEPEAEMPEDDTTERLGAWIDPAAVMVEALALHIPLYPRKDEAEMGQLVYTEPGQAPMTDEDARPFAGLAGLRDKLEKD